MINLKSFTALRDEKVLAKATIKKTYNDIVDLLEQDDALIGQRLLLVGNDNQNAFRFAIDSPLFADFNDEASMEIQITPVFMPTSREIIVVIYRDFEPLSANAAWQLLEGFNKTQQDKLWDSWMWIERQYETRLILNFSELERQV